MKEQKRLGVGRRINVLKNAKCENDARKFWTTWNKENANMNVCHMHSANDLAQQFYMNLNSKCHNDIVNIAFSRKVHAKRMTECVSMITVEDVELAVHSLNVSKCLDCEKLSHV